MDAHTLEALRASIAKWERNAAATDVRDYIVGADECVLCHKFNKAPSYCKGCPVRKVTGEQFCVGTPYSNAAVNYGLWKSGDNAAKIKALAFAREEVAFLKSLLPSEEI